MALIAAHLNAGMNHSGGDSVAIGILSPSSSPISLHTPSPAPSPFLPVPNKPYGFCGR